MSAIILHHYDASPFTQKALRMLGIKGLSWQSVETPMMLPKPDLTVLTGGYRGTPVMQIGADVYVDTQRIAVELERRFPEPTLFPTGVAGLDLALVEFGDAFFHSGLRLALTFLVPTWDEAFTADRDSLFDYLDFDEVRADADHARAQLRAYASLLNDQLSDDRPFLTGSQPAMADVQAFSVLWFTRAGLDFVNDLLADLSYLPAWERRVDDLGEGTREPISAATAHGVARGSAPETKPTIDAADGKRFSPNSLVLVEPDDSRRGAVAGELVVLKANQVAVRHHNETVGTVVVHFPRVGYRVSQPGG